MTLTDFQFIIDTRRAFEFVFNGTKYNLTYDTTPDGKTVFVFGETFLGKRYSSLGELMNEAMIENHYFKDVLPTL